ncbi:MAG: zinc-dependent metalloprotease [Candidatus Kapaibacterium sp.]
MKKLFTMSVLLLAMSITAGAQQRYVSAAQFLYPAKTSVPGLASNAASARAFDYQAQDARAIFQSTTTSLSVADFPIGLNETGTLELKERPSVFDGETRAFKIVAGKRIEVRLPSSRTFSGSIRGDNGSKVIVVSTGDDMYVSMERGNGTMLQIAPATTKKNTLVLQDNTHGATSSFSCGFENLPDARQPMPNADVLRTVKGSVLQATDQREALVAIETDRFLWTRMGKDEAKITRYLYTIFATVSWIYEREANVSFVLGTIIIHTDTDPDPYTENANGDIGALLAEFSANWRANYGTVKRNLAVLFTVPGKTDVGGIAYLATLCTTRGFAACGIQTNSVLPTQGYQWDAFVTAHEVGHIFGAKHTHACDWGPPIDSCVSTGGSIPIGDACWNGTPKPSKGSIMSYCHLMFPPPRYTFLDQVAAVVRAGAERTGCLKPPVNATIKVTQPIGGADQIVRSDTGVSIEWTSTKVTNVNIEYRLDAGKTLTAIASAVNLPATDRFYKWMPPAGVRSTQTLIRIYSTANAAVADTSYATFTLGAPALTLKSLSGGERIGRNTNETVTWERTFLSRNRLEFSATGSDPWTTVLPDTTLLQFTWKVPDIETSSARLRVVGGAGNSIVSMSGPFAIGTPTFKLLGPLEGDSACVGGKYTVKWQSDFIRAIDIRYSRNNGTTFPINQSIVANYDATTQSFVWTVPTGRNSDSAVIRVTNLADPSQPFLSGRFSIRVCQGVNSVGETLEMNGLRIARIFPAPVSDVIGLSVENNRGVAAPAEVSIVSADGRTVGSYPLELTVGVHRHSIPAGDLASGAYILLLRAQGTELSLPFVVSR